MKSKLNVTLSSVEYTYEMALVSFKSCNALPIIQSIIQNGGVSLNIRRTLINFEVVLEIRECV